MEAPPPSYRRRSVLRDAVVCVARAGHPATHRKRPLDLAEYAALPHVSFVVDGTEGNAIDALLARSGHARRVVARVVGFEASCAILATSDAVTLLPGRLLPRARRLGIERIASPFDTQRLATTMVWHESMQEDPFHKWLRRIVVVAAAAASATSEKKARRKLRTPAM